MKIIDNNLPINPWLWILSIEETDNLSYTSGWLIPEGYRDMSIKVKL